MSNHASAHCIIVSYLSAAETRNPCICTHLNPFSMCGCLIGTNGSFRKRYLIVCARTYLRDCKNMEDHIATSPAAMRRYDIKSPSGGGCAGSPLGGFHRRRCRCRQRQTKANPSYPRRSKAIASEPKRSKTIDHKRSKAMQSDPK